MNGALRDQALQLVHLVQDYIREAERRGVPAEKADEIREAITYLLRWAYE